MTMCGINIVVLILVALVCRVETKRNEGLVKCSTSINCGYYDVCMKGSKICTGSTKRCYCKIGYSGKTGCLDRFGNKACRFDEECIKGKNKKCTEEKMSSKKCACKSTTPTTPPNNARQCTVYDGHTRVDIPANQNNNFVRIADTCRECWCADPSNGKSIGVGLLLHCRPIRNCLPHFLRLKITK